MRLIDKLREYLFECQGRVVTTTDIRKELNLEPNSPAWNGVRVCLLRLAEEKIVRPSGKRDGEWKVVKQVTPVTTKNAERRPPTILLPPTYDDSFAPLDFWEYITFREGDMILISGQSNWGKTALCLNICGENIDKNPVLMGNEYTTLDGQPNSRFLSRIDSMDWVNWYDDNGDRFTLLPVRDDYAEHIIKDRINIIDWINLPDELYKISSTMEAIKRELGKGIAVAAIQKSENSTSGRGGQFTKDFADLEILLDKYTTTEAMITIGKVKESTQPLLGKTYAFGLRNGTKIINFREITKCGACRGSGYIRGDICDTCNGTGWINKKQ
jgi:hypothetical protein